jgi:hypothetical protein
MLRTLCINSINTPTNKFHSQRYTLQNLFFQNLSHVAQRQWADFMDKFGALNELESSQFVFSIFSLHYYSFEKKYNSIY